MTAQSFHGQVFDQKNLPVEEVFIQDSRTGEHTHSDKKGLYSLNNVLVGDTLTFTHLAYMEHYEIVLELDNKLMVQLKTKVYQLEEIKITPSLDALNLITDISLHTNPVNSSQEILRKVPGLIIGQHAGGGKAEQIFLRGFDIDHGTDINIQVDGMPVNMVSHAHGQGYSDLHFLIPETIEKIGFGKGPYKADKGNFTTAGYVSFDTKDRLENNLIKLEAGQFNTQRLLAMLNIMSNERHSAYIASEYLLSNGPFISPQNFHRYNIMGKYSGILTGGDKLSISASLFQSRWDASGQIPESEVLAGNISRFGAIDDTEGGQTGRSNIILSHTKNINENSFLKSTIYYSHYDFELYSNLTFFLNDPVNGDQIRQRETRNMYGLQSEYNYSFTLGEIRSLVQTGVGYRADKSVNNELSHTMDRQTTLETISLGDIHESNTFAYLNSTFEFGKWTINPALRLDHFRFGYYDRLEPDYELQAESKNILCPKFNILYTPGAKLQFYLKSGKGFHSNDSRVVVAQNGKKILPAAYGSDLGLLWKPTTRTLINFALWHLYLEQEFVYVGDEGVVEAGGRTNRSGIEFSLAHQLLDWLFLNSDITYTMARSADEPDGENYIPLAPDLTLTGGLAIKHPTGYYSGLNFRHIGDRPANEDNSIVAKGYTVVDANIGYIWKNLDVGIKVQNLFNAAWNEAQFATESRIKSDGDAVDQLHFTPGTPFFVQGKVAYMF